MLLPRGDGECGALLRKDRLGEVVDEGGGGLNGGEELGEGGVGEGAGAEGEGGEGGGGGDEGGEGGGGEGGEEVVPFRESVLG